MAHVLLFGRLMRSTLPLALSLFLALPACDGSSSSDVTGSGPGSTEPAPPDGTTPPGEPPTTPPTTPPSAGTTYFPPAAAANTWETVDASAAKFDPAKLAELTTWVEQTSATTFMIVYDGRILVEKYWGSDAATLRDIASAQKSVSSLLVGAAIAQGAFGLEDKVTSILGDGWSNGTPAEEAPITVRQLLTMTSGLDGQLEYDAAAGTKWLYNTDAYHRLELVLETKTGKSLQDYTRAALLDPIGAGGSLWTKRQFQKDAKGVPISALEMNARDMARVGLLVMADGAWNGKVVVPSTYLATALQTSQSLNESYGFLFWLNGKSGGLMPPSTPKTGMLMPSGPSDIVAALGANDQKIYVSRSQKLVVTRQGGKAAEGGAAGTSWDDDVWKRIMAAKLP